MDKRKQILESIYGDGREETRLIRTRHGQLEYFTTMTCIEYHYKFLLLGSLSIDCGRNYREGYKHN